MQHIGCNDCGAGFAQSIDAFFCQLIGAVWWHIPEKGSALVIVKGNCEPLQNCTGSMLCNWPIVQDELIADCTFSFRCCGLTWHVV